MRSARPLDAGWYGATQKCFIPLALQKFENSEETNCGPLSLTSCLGRPCIANVPSKTFIVLVTVVDVMSTISGHLEKALTSIKKVLPIKGPAKSKCTLTHGLAGHIHGCHGIAIGAF